MGPGANMFLGDGNPFPGQPEPQPHPKKGGLRLTPNLTYNCLVEDENKPLAVDCSLFVCPVCEVEMYSSPLARMAHFATCKGKEEEEESKEMAVKEEERRQEEGANPLSRKYYCDQCKTALRLTSSEILKHRRSCGVKTERLEEGH